MIVIRCDILRFQLLSNFVPFKDSLDGQSTSPLQLELDSLTKKQSVLLFFWDLTLYFTYSKELSEKIQTMEDNLSAGDVLSSDEERRY